jgi:hypothetical protein
MIFFDLTLLYQHNKAKNSNIMHYTYIIQAKGNLNCSSTMDILVEERNTFSCVLQNIGFYKSLSP